MAADSIGRLVVAFVKSSQVHVSRLSGGTWSPLGEILNVVATNAASGVRIAIDSQDRPVVLWVENSALHTKRWNGASWDLVVGPIGYSTGGYALAIGAADGPLVAVNGGVSGVSGFNVDTTGDVSLTVDGSGRPIVASIVAGTVRVVVPGLPPNSWYTSLGSPLGINAKRPTILHRPVGSPAEHLLLSYWGSAAAAGAPGPGMKVLTWDGGAWTLLPSGLGTLSSFLGNTALLFANGVGAVAAARSESQGVCYRLTTMRYTG
jgi:hypothetical protein